VPDPSLRLLRNANRQLSTGRTRLAQVRVNADVSQTQLSERSGVSLTTLQRIERGEITNPGIRSLVAIAEALGCTVDELIDPSWRPSAPQR
jgi:transcriptional regulator with XRE-family HTH domain